MCNNKLMPTPFQTIHHVPQPKEPFPISVTPAPPPPLPPKSNKKVVIFVIMIIVLFLISFGGIWFYQNFINIEILDKDWAISTPTPEATMEDEMGDWKIYTDS